MTSAAVGASGGTGEPWVKAPGSRAHYLLAPVRRRGCPSRSRRRMRCRRRTRFAIPSRCVRSREGCGQRHRAGSQRQHRRPHLPIRSRARLWRSRMPDGGGSQAHGPALQSAHAGRPVTSPVPSMACRVSICVASAAAMAAPIAGSCGLPVEVHVSRSSTTATNTTGRRWPIDDPRAAKARRRQRVLRPNDGPLPLYICARSQCLEHDLSPVAEAQPEHRANYTVSEQNRINAQTQVVTHMIGEPVAYLLDCRCPNDVPLRTADLVHQGRLAGAQLTTFPWVSC